MKIPIVIALSLFFLQTPASSKASIEGVVLRAGTNQPVAEARIMLVTSTQTGPLGPLAVTADSEGRFVLRGIDPGAYRIEIAADGYSHMQYGQRVPTGLERPGTDLGTLVTLNAGQSLTGIVVRLTPTGTISGRLRDMSGHPAVDVPVQLLRASYSQNNERGFIPVASAQTDDRGEYRLYWITPGRYYIAVGFTPGPLLPSVLPNNRALVQYPLTYYPGVYDIASAKAMDVAPGEELKGSDMVLEQPQLYRIRGRVIDLGTGRWPEAARPSLTFLGFTSFGGVMSNGTYNPTDGTFEFRDVLPGSYLAGISVPNPSSGTARAIPVTITRADVDGLVVTVTPMVSIPIQITVDGREFSSVANLDRWRVNLRDNNKDTKTLMPGLNGTTPSALTSNGLSKFENVLPGSYLLQVLSAPPPGVYVKTVTYRDKDAVNEAIQISGSEAGAFSVILGTNPGRIDGTILDSANQPAAGSRAVLVPDQHRDRIDLYKSVDADAAGHFSLRDVPPGDYKMYAWESIEPYSW
jgi:hypothetical protein